MIEEFDDSSVSAYNMQEDNYDDEVDDDLISQDDTNDSKNRPNMSKRVLSNFNYAIGVPVSSRLPFMD